LTIKSLDLGCGITPRNPFNAEELYGVDIRGSEDKKILIADLAIDSIPFNDNFFDYCSAYDFIEHIPRVIYIPKRKFAFVDLMSEIYRVLKSGGKFLSVTPAFPNAPAFRDPTHVNIITDETFPLYFDNKNCWAKIYGFIGGFEIETQYWHKNKIHLVTILKKPQLPINNAKFK
jgi:SAM-dependent methyltransferase